MEQKITQPLFIYSLLAMLSYFVPFGLIFVAQYGLISEFNTDSLYHTIISKIHTEYCGVRP